MEDGEERIIPHDAPAILNELRRTREISRTRGGQIKSLQAERDALAARVAALEPVAAEVDKLKPIAERWHEHERIQTDTLKQANAEKIKALTPEQMKAFEGITDEALISRMLALVAPPPATPATPATPAAPPSYPAGGAAPVTGSGAGAELTPAEEAWVRSERKDLLTAGVEASTIKAMFKKFGPK